MGLKILLADDSRPWLKLLARALAPYDYEICSAASCEDAVRMSGLFRPDCLILDFYLGDGTALDVCARLKADKDTRHTPVIILSADPDVEESAYGDCGAKKFLLKTESLSKIPEIVAGLVNARREGAG